MTDSRVDDSTPCDAKTTAQGAPSQPIESDEIVSKATSRTTNSLSGEPLAVDQILSLTLLPPTTDAAITVVQLPFPALPLGDESAATTPVTAQTLPGTPAKTFNQLAASMALSAKTVADESATCLGARTPAVLSACSSDQGVVYEWDFWRPHAQYLSDTLATPATHVPRYQRSLMDSCGLVAAVLAHYDLLHVSEVTLYAFSALVDDEVQYRFQPDQHPEQAPELSLHHPFQQNLYYPTYEIGQMAALEPLLGQYFKDQVLPTELEFAGQGDIIGVGRFDNPFSFSYEVFESFERIRIQTRSTAWLTCDLNAMPQMALYTANGWRLEQAMTDLVFFLGQQGFGLEQNHREKIAFSQDVINLQNNATRYAEWDGDYLLNRSTLEPAGDQLLDVVNLFNLHVQYAQTID